MLIITYIATVSGLSEFKSWYGTSQTMTVHTPTYNNSEIMLDPMIAIGSDRSGDLASWAAVAIESKPT